MRATAADFGLSTSDERSLDEVDSDSSSSGLKLPSNAVGTADYLAPELLVRHQTYSYAVDFWALGIVLYQLILGETPFEADETQDTYRRILELEYTRPSTDDMSESACALIAALLVSDPARRLGSGDEGLMGLLEHDFFCPLELFDEPPLWQRQAIFTPTLKHDCDTSNFDMNALQKARAEELRTQVRSARSSLVRIGIARSGPRAARSGEGRRGVARRGEEGVGKRGRGRGEATRARARAPEHPQRNHLSRPPSTQPPPPKPLNATTPSRAPFG